MTWMWSIMEYTTVATLGWMTVVGIKLLIDRGRSPPNDEPSEGEQDG
jgi:hypothetical protein